MTPAPRMRRVRALGSTAVEFAVILPLAITVMFGAIEAGRMIACRQMLTYAMMEGARTAAALGTPDTAAVASAVVAAAPMLGISTGNVLVTTYGSTCSGATKAYTSRVAGDCVEVRLSTPYSFSPMLAGSWWPSGRAWDDRQTQLVF